MTLWSSSTFLLARPKVPSCVDVLAISLAQEDICVSGFSRDKTYSLLGELAGALVARVAQELNDAALVGSEASNLLDDLTDESGALAQVALGAGDAGLDNASGGLLYSGKKRVECQRPSSAIERKFP